MEKGRLPSSTKITALLYILWGGVYQYCHDYQSEENNFSIIWKTITALHRGMMISACAEIPKTLPMGGYGVHGLILPKKPWRKRLLSVFSASADSIPRKNNKSYYRIGRYMVSPFITFKEKGSFKNREVIFPKEFKRISAYAVDFKSDDSIFNYPSRADLSRMRSGYWVFVYVKAEKMDMWGFRNILKTIFGRCGATFSTRWNEYYALIPKWGEPKLYDKDGKKYDVRRAINLYAKGMEWEEVWKEVNKRRREHGKPPYAIKRC